MSLRCLKPLVSHCLIVLNAILLLLVMTGQTRATTTTLPSSPASASAETWRFRSDFIAQLASQVPDILASQDPVTGRWGTGIWIVTDQHPMWPLAVAYSTDDPANPYHRNPRLLDAITSGGDALIADADSQGQWEFRKKDGSTWGPIRMPWTYTRWMRTYQLVRDDMSTPTRTRWDKALQLGYKNIAAHDMDHVHNIPAYHAVGLYSAGQVFDREDWRTQAIKMFRDVMAGQADGGFWSENHGPVVGYGVVYVEALGAYYTLSGDKSVLPAIDRAARFHSNFTWPNGTAITDIDERQTYKHSIPTPASAFFITRDGRTYAKRQLDLIRRRTPEASLSSDVLASVIVGGVEGPVDPPQPADQDRVYVMPDHNALVKNSGDWAVCFSAYACPVPQRRWIQDRQNLVGLYHKTEGLLLGGGNTKLTPLWSTFTVGDTSLLKHIPGNENPDFTPPLGLLHVPTSGTVHATTPPRMDLEYGDARMHIIADLSNPTTATLTYAVDRASTVPIEAHLPLMPHLGKNWSTAAGKSGILSSGKIDLAADETGQWFQLDDVRYTLPTGSTIKWPVLMHNPYAKYGETTPASGGRLVITIPFARETSEKTINITVTK